MLIIRPLKALCQKDRQKDLEQPRERRKKTEELGKEPDDEV